jgi:hypothetical protein
VGFADSIFSPQRQRYFWVHQGHTLKERRTRAGEQVIPPRLLGNGTQQRINGLEVIFSFLEKNSYLRFDLPLPWLLFDSEVREKSLKPLENWLNLGDLRAHRIARSVVHEAKITADEGEASFGFPDPCLDASLKRQCFGVALPRTIP